MSVMHTVIENDNIQVTNSLCVVIDNIQEKEVQKQTMILKTLLLLQLINLSCSYLGISNLTLRTLGKIFIRPHIEYFFFIFPKK